MASRPGTYIRTRIPYEQRFWSKVDIRSTDECWPWTGAQFYNEYGSFWSGVDTKTELAHRVAFRLSNGSIDEALLVLHSCDYHPCCNPKHLSQGTHKQNTEQMHARSRGHTKLSDRDVRALRDLHETGRFTKTQIAQIFSISQTHASSLIANKTRKAA